MKKMDIFLMLVFIIIISISLLLQFYPKKIEQSEYVSWAERFLDTKTTNKKGLGCGPPDDWDCGYSKYQDLAILANIQYYKRTGNEKYLQYAINFANTRPTSPQYYCSKCICNMPDDVDCGDAETQYETIYTFARLYEITKNKTYLDFAEKVAETRPSNPPDWCKKDWCFGTLCGPPDKWDCIMSSYQLGFYESYELLYKLTDNSKYKKYMQNLLDGFQNKLPEDLDEIGIENIYSINLYVYVYNATGESKYLEIAKEKAIRFASLNYPCGQIEKWQCLSDKEFHQSRIILPYISLYNVTGEKKFLDIAVKFADEGGIDCGPNVGWVCRDYISQAHMISAYYAMHKITGDEKYLYYFNNFISPESFERLNCNNFDCDEAAFNYMFAITFMDLTNETSFYSSVPYLLII